MEKGERVAERCDRAGAQTWVVLVIPDSRERSSRVLLRGLSFSLGYVRTRVEPRGTAQQHLEFLLFPADSCGAPAFRGFGVHVGSPLIRRLEMRASLEKWWPFSWRDGTPWLTSGSEFAISKVEQQWYQLPILPVAANRKIRSFPQRSPPVAEFHPNRLLCLRAIRP